MHSQFVCPPVSVCVSFLKEHSPNNPEHYIASSSWKLKEYLYEVFRISTRHLFKLSFSFWFMIHSPENMDDAVQVGSSNRLRRSQKKDDETPASLFLRKAYHVVCYCPPSIGKIQHWILNEEVMLLSSEFTSSLLCTASKFLLGGWSMKGDTFIIKDAKKFSEKVIPTVYKHNNFSSFVRQLNFCKFWESSLRAYRSHLRLVLVHHP